MKLAEKTAANLSPPHTFPNTQRKSGKNQRAKKATTHAQKAARTFFGNSTNTDAPSNKARPPKAMAPTTRASSRQWAVSRVTALPEFWGLVAEHSGLVGAWRLTGVCRASRVGAKEWLRTLRRLVVCGGCRGGGYTSAVWRLDLGKLRWERMSDLGGVRADHACCTVRGRVVVLAGKNSGGEEGALGALATVEVLRSSDSEEAEEHTFTALPPLSCCARFGSIALPIAESGSAEGQVLLLGGLGELLDDASRVVTVDLATGACTPHPSLLYDRWCFAAARLPDGRVVCVGDEDDHDDDDDDDDDNFPAIMTAEVLDSPEQGSPDDAV